MTQAHSLALLDQALHHMQERFLANKLAVVVTKSRLTGCARDRATLTRTSTVDRRSQWQFEVERVQALLASVFSVHVLHVNFLVRCIAFG